MLICSRASGEAGSDMPVSLPEAGERGPPIDASTTFSLETCPEDCPTGFAAGYGTPELNQYIGTGTEVDLYGTVEYCCNCCGFLLNVTSVARHPCASVAVTSRSWTSVKRLYQDASK